MFLRMRVTAHLTLVAGLAALTFFSRTPALSQGVSAFPTNGTNGQGLTSNGKGAYGTPVTLAASATTDATNATNIVTGTLGAARLPTTVPQWLKTTWLYEANLTGTCANATGCWVVTKTNGTAVTTNGAAATTQTLAVTPAYAYFWVSGVRVVPTVQCSTAATGLVVKFVGDNDALSAYASPNLSLTAAVSNTAVYSSSAAGSNDIAGTQTATVTVGVGSGTIDQTVAGCAFSVYLLISTNQ